MVGKMCRSHNIGHVCVCLLKFPTRLLSTVFIMAEEGNGTRTIELLEDLVRIFKDVNVFDDNQRVIEFLHPEKLQKVLDVRLSENPISKEDIQDIIQKVIKYSVKTFSDNFHNQLYSGCDKYGLIGAWLTELLNTSQYTYEVAPVFTLMEKEVIEQGLKLFGYPTMPDGDGIMNPGGSLSNMYGMVLARYQSFPEVKTKGLNQLPPLACFTSEDGHYSITKAAHWLGLGTENVYKIKSDKMGRMDPNDLKRAIIESRKGGSLPFFVNATAGTTVLGAFDPLLEIARVCREEDLWMHVDACLGGNLLLSDKYRHRLEGIEHSDSVSWNPHKMLGAPFQCSIFLVKGKNALHEANCAGAKYLFQQDKFYNVSWDTGDKSIQCGRKVESLKFWLMWKARGTGGLKQSIDHAMSMAEYFLEQIRNREGFRLVLPNYECCNICFWYIPPSMRDQEETKNWWEKLYTIAPKIKELMVLEGSLMVGYTPLTQKNLGNFFRLVVTCQPPPSQNSMNYVIEQIERFGKML